MKPQTRAIHGAFLREPMTGATVVPIYQSAAFCRETAQELADIFSGRAPGDVYSRISNPTNQVLERRLVDKRFPSCLMMASRFGMSRQALQNRDRRS